MSTPDSALGAALRRARADAGQSLEQVSARTRIRTAVLRDLEAGRLASSGGEVYARGHVRSVAQALGTDPAPLLAVFDAEAGRPVPVVVEPATLPAPRTGSLGVPGRPRPERRGPHWGGAVVAALSVLVLLLAVGTLNGVDEREPAAAEELFAAPTASAVAPPKPVATKPPAPRPAPTAAVLRVRVLQGSSWVRVQGAGGATLFEGVVRQGQAPRDFRDAQQLRLLVGNAAALGLGCAGKELAPAGGAGAVGRFTCSRQGLART